MKFIIKRLLYLTAYIISLSTITCSRYNVNNSTIIILNDWEVNIGKGWKKTLPAPWETPVEKGGIGALNYDGFGEYRTRFIVPDNLKSETLAFYTQCLDDADIAYLNGAKIGETGIVPQNEDDVINNNFRSGSWEARYYILPHAVLRLDTVNEIRIRVFDFAGEGGFCFPQKPVIGPYKELGVIARNYLFYTDIPRTAIIAGLLMILIVFHYHLIVISSREIFLYALKRIRDSFNFILFVTGKDKPFNWNNVFGEFAYRYIMAITIGILYAVAIFSQTTFKYSVVENEIFWFKICPAAIFLGIICVISILHQDVFGRSLSFSKNSKPFDFLRLVLSIASHPGLMLTYFICVIVLSAQSAWSKFINTGITIALIILIILFVATIINLIRVSIGDRDSLFNKILLKEGIIRIIFITLFILSVIIVKVSSPKFTGMLVLFIVIFTMIYFTISILFFIRYRINLPHAPVKRSSLLPVLQAQFNLTYKEAEISDYIFHGLSREEIGEKLHISEGTLKNHFKSIYAKTIEMHIDLPDNRVGKLQRLTIFLHNLSVSDKN